MNATAPAPISREVFQRRLSRALEKGIIDRPTLAEAHGVFMPFGGIDYERINLWLTSKNPGDLPSQQKMRFIFRHIARAEIELIRMKRRHRQHPEWAAARHPLRAFHQAPASVACVPGGSRAA